MSKMQIGEALNAIEDGHAIWKPEYAQRVCTALSIPFDEELVQRFYSENHYLGAHMKDGCEGAKGVNGLSLSAYCAKQFGVFKRATSFFGRGSQAREYARLVRQELEEQGKI
jgi:hypothetical protein